MFEALMTSIKKMLFLMVQSYR